MEFNKATAEKLASKMSQANQKYLSIDFKSLPQNPGDDFTQFLEHMSLKDFVTIETTSNHPEDIFNYIEHNKINVDYIAAITCNSKTKTPSRYRGDGMLLGLNPTSTTLANGFASGVGISDGVIFEYTSKEAIILTGLDTAQGAIKITNNMYGSKSDYEFQAAGNSYTLNKKLGNNVVWPLTTDDKQQALNFSVETSQTPVEFSLVGLPINTKIAILGLRVSKTGNIMIFNIGDPATRVAIDRKALLSHTPINLGALYNEAVRENEASRKDPATATGSLQKSSDGNQPSGSDSRPQARIPAKPDVIEALGTAFRMLAKLKNGRKVGPRKKDISEERYEAGYKALNVNSPAVPANQSNLEGAIRELLTKVTLTDQNIFDIKAKASQNAQGKTSRSRASDAANIVSAAGVKATTTTSSSKPLYAEVLPVAFRDPDATTTTDQGVIYAGGDYNTDDADPAAQSLYSKVNKGQNAAVGHPKEETYTTVDHGERAGNVPTGSIASDVIYADVTGYGPKEETYTTVDHGERAGNVPTGSIASDVIYADLSNLPDLSISATSSTYSKEDAELYVKLGGHANDWQEAPAMEGESSASDYDRSSPGDLSAAQEQLDAAATTPTYESSGYGSDEPEPLYGGADGPAKEGFSTGDRGGDGLPQMPSRSLKPGVQPQQPVGIVLSPEAVANRGSGGNSIA